MLLAGIVVFAAALRFATLDVQSYWFDEATTVQLLRDDLPGLLGAIPDSESTPPLYYVLAWAWSKLFGTGEIGLRSLSALFGTATVVAVYAVGARWASRRAGLIAAALAATSPLLIWYSQEARAYALLVLLGALTLVVLPDAIEGRQRLVPWAVLSALALATHYFAAFLVVPEAAWLLYRWRARALPAVAAVALVGLALAPLAIGQAENDGARFIRESSLANRLATIPKQLLVGYNSPAEIVATVVAAAIAAAGLWLLATRNESRERGAGLPLLALGGVSLAVPALGALVGADYLITRNVIVAWVPIFVALAIGFAAARRAGTAAALVLCALGVAVYAGVETDERYQRDDWRGVAEALGPAHGPRVVVVTPVNGRIPLEIYLDGARKAPAGPSVTAQEVDVVTLASRTAGTGAKPSRAPTPPQPPSFSPGARREAETYTLITYRAISPQPVPVATLYQLALGGSAELVTQPARLPGR
jgi:hypothetical protein